MGENTRNHYYNVDLNKPLSKRYSGLLLATGDNNGDVFHFAISKDGVNLADNDAVTFTAFFIRGDDITVTPEVVKENGAVHVALDDTCYRREGRFVLTVKSTLSGNTTTAAIVDGYIRQTDSGNYIADEEQTITLDKIQGMANDMAMFYEQAKEKMEELSGATENLENALEEAETITEKLPYIGDNGNWMQWDDDAKQFIDSGSPSRGIPGVNGTTPVKGKDYFDGEPGYTPQKNVDYFDGTSVTVSGVSESTADGGTNTVTFSDGKKLNIRNGNKGAPGYTPVKGRDYFDGSPGKTPVKGEDYYTAADKAELVAEVKEQIEGEGGGAPAIHADQHSWSDTLTWDGDETGRTTAVMGSNSNEEYKVVLLSEKVPTVADLANGYSIYEYDSDYGFVTKEYSLDDAGVNSDGAMMLPDESYIFVIPTDNYVYKEVHGSFTFPKAGVYFYYNVIDGEVEMGAKRLTIHGYNFIKSTDPITPEMIGAAPKSHASESDECGVGTDKKYGHLKVADIGNVFTGGEVSLLDIAIELPNDDPMIDLKPYALGAYTGYACLNYLATYVNDHDVLVTEHNKSIRNLQQQTLKQDDRPSIITDALAALAGADPSNATAAVIETLTGRTSTLEAKVRNAAEDIATMQAEVDIFETTFFALCHPQFNSDDPDKMTFMYTSRVMDEEWNETLYPDITLASPTGDVYAGKMNYDQEEMYTRKKLATEEYVQNAMILTAPNGRKFRLTVDNNGNLGTVAVE